MVIQTVNGEIDGSELGHTLMHEHVFSFYNDMRTQESWDEEALIEEAVRQLSLLRGKGIESIVDMTVYGLGRFVPRIARVARESGITVVPATGVYSFLDLPLYFKGGTNFLSRDFISDLFVREITEGIGETGIRAAVLKLATDSTGFSAESELLLEQTARAQQLTGVPISTHTHAASKNGIEQQDRLERAGVSLDRVLIGHSGDSVDLGYLCTIADRGSWLGMDRFGHEPFRPLGERIETVAELCRRGYAERIVLSHDTSVVTDAVPQEARESESFANWNYQCIPDLVIPGLRAAGVTESQLTAMLVDNPRRILESTL